MGRLKKLNLQTKRFLALLLAIFMFGVAIMPSTYALTEEDRKQLYTPFYDENAVCELPTIDGGGPIPATNEEYIKQYGQLAFNTGKKYGIPYDAILAQSAHESGWGKSGLTRAANNFFGIKAGSGWNGPVYITNTVEYVNGRPVTQRDVFRAYPDVQAGFNGYGEFIRDNPRYKEALQHPNDP